MRGGTGLSRVSRGLGSFQPSCGTKAHGQEHGKGRVVFGLRTLDTLLEGRARNILVTWDVNFICYKSGCLVNSYC